MTDWTEVGTVTGADGLVRCGWGVSTPEYVAYHDDEWGRPVTDDVRIYEKLTLEGFQSGLSWLTILRKRPAFRMAFAGFDPDAVARFGPADVDRLMADAGIVRHRGKIEAAIANAGAVVAARRRHGSLAALVWSFEPARADRTAPRKLGDLPPATSESQALARALKALGFRFIGPTTAYAAMQALGVVNDHFLACHRREPCDDERAAMGERPELG